MKKALTSDEPKITKVIVDVRLGATIVSIPATNQKRVMLHGRDVGKAEIEMPENLVYQNATDAEEPDKPWEPMAPATPRNIDDPLVQATREFNEEVFMNNLYTVIRSKFPYPGTDLEMVHLSIRRNDRRPITDWRHKQKIKNELVGPECEGVELFPAESRLVDTSNQYHLWVIPTPGERVPVGYEDGRVVTGTVLRGNAVQRPFVDGEEETTSPEELQRMADDYLATGGTYA